MLLNPRLLLALAALGLGLVAWLVWAWEHTESPAWPVMVANLVAVVGLAVGPWLLLSGRYLILRARERDPAAGRAFSRALVSAGFIAGTGLVAALLFGVLFGGRPDSTVPVVGAVALVTLVGATVVALVGGVFFPWMFMLARTVTRERTARARAEERAGVAAHLHDSVLQALTLIQKQADDSRAVRRLARTTERGLRVWLYGEAASADVDFSGAVVATAEEIEDRFDVTVEVVTVGTGPLDARAQAMLGAVREALTNAAKHSQVRDIKLFTEVADVETLAVVRDRGRGFDPAAPNAADRRGLSDSIEGRMRQHGGTAAVRSALGEGTEIELRLPRSEWHD